MFQKLGGEFSYYSVLSRDHQKYIKTKTKAALSTIGYEYKKEDKKASTYQSMRESLSEVFFDAIVYGIMSGMLAFEYQSVKDLRSCAETIALLIPVTETDRITPTEGLIGIVWEIINTTFQERHWEGQRAIYKVHVFLQALHSANPDFSAVI